MSINAVWLTIITVSLLFSVFSGREAEAGAAVLEGTGAAIELCIGIGGVICLWCAVMELMRQCGITEALSRLLRPILKKLFPEASSDEKIMGKLSANVSANLLGLGNAATPMGIQTVQGMARLCEGGRASDELCRFVVLNTASIQLLPTTAAAIRAAEGAASPFDILPAVWLSSAISVTVGLCSARLMERCRQ